MTDFLNMTKQYTAFLLIGGNLGNRTLNLTTSIQLIETNCGNIIQTSSIYQTAAWGITNQPNFLNQVLIVQTKLSPKQLMQKLLHIEEQMGRQRTVKFGPRIIDIDILLMDELIVNTSLVTIPHPAIAQRRFVLIPLAELIPNYVHPVDKKTISQLLLTCTDILDVQKITLPAL